MSSVGKINEPNNEIIIFLVDENRYTKKKGIYQTKLWKETYNLQLHDMTSEVQFLSGQLPSPNQLLRLLPGLFTHLLVQSGVICNEFLSRNEDLWFTRTFVSQHSNRLSYADNKQPNYYRFF